MYKIMNSWSDLQCKRRQDKTKMNQITAFVRMRSDHYKVVIRYDVIENSIVLKPEDPGTYECLLLNERNINGFLEDNTSISITRPARLTPIVLDFSNRENLLKVIELLRKIASDESSDSGASEGSANSTSSPSSE